MKIIIKKIFSPRNLGAVIAILIVTGATALAQIPAYKSWLIQGTNLYTTGTNVGIGTTDPSEKLQVNGVGAFESAKILSAIPQTGGGAMRLGYDTTSPGTTLIRSVGTGASKGQLKFQHTTVDYSGGIIDAMMIDSSGNVGIGTANPNQTLAIVGSFGVINGGSQWQFSPESNRLKISETGIGEHLTILNSSGNVGIGTTNPNAKLDVLGDVKWSGSLVGGSVPWANITGFTGDATPDTIADDNVISDSEVSDNITINNGAINAPPSGTVNIATALMVAGGNNINQQLPDGLKGTPITTTLPYNVPSGKTFYVANILYEAPAPGSARIKINGIAIADLVTNSSRNFNPPLIVGAGQSITVTITGGLGPVTVNGLLADASVATAVTSSGSYNVPAGKRFIISAAYLIGGGFGSINIAGTKVAFISGGSLTNGFTSSFPGLIIAGPGQQVVIRTSFPQTSTLNGYVVDN